jgi:hypothetical protein
MSHAMNGPALATAERMTQALTLDQEIEALYVRARDRAQRGGLWTMLKGRSRCLLALEEVVKEEDTSFAEQTHGCAGIQRVQIAQICGSESRSSDFDRDFNPLQDHNKGRWLSVASARRRGKALPPVDLIQVGDAYFVCDGHHRVSVARALGQQDIEAKVIVWQVSGSSPWESQTQVSAPSRRGRERGLGLRRHVLSLLGAGSV